MSKEILKELTLNGIRWANNILIEVLSSYATRVDGDGKGTEHLRDAVRSLSEAVNEFRKQPS